MAKSDKTSFYHRTKNLQFPSSAVAASSSSLSSDHKPPPPPTPETLLHLRRQLAETRKLNAALRANHAQNAALLSDLTSLLSSSPPPATSAPKDHPTTSLAFLTQPHPHPTASLSANSTSAATTAPLTTTAQFVTSQLPALRQLVADLRPRLQTMQESGDKGVDWDGKREERRRYIETGVRRVVGRGGGGGGGKELQNGAERRGVEEVEALEGLF